MLVDEISLRELCFRWANFDPERIYFKLPLPVRDHVRTLLSEILNGHLDCETLRLEKYYGDDREEAQFYIRTWLPLINNAIRGIEYDGRLLKWAGIERWTFQEWCERRNIPLPEFWFPPGWTDYQWQEAIDSKTVPNESQVERKLRIDDRHRIKMATQQIGLYLWKSKPQLTIKEVSISPEVQDMAGASRYELETVQEWLSEIDPRDPSKKRGRKRNNNWALPET